MKTLEFDRESMLKDPTSQGVQYVEGYWYDQNHQGLPKPKKHSEPWPNQPMWLEQLKWVEGRIAQHESFDNAWHNTGREELRYFKYGEGTASFCRICDRSNGWREYQVRVNGLVYRWPEGFRHYVEDHNVIPSKEFYYLINGLFSRLR